MSRLMALPPLRPWPRWLLLAKKWWKEGVFLQRFVRIKHSAYNGIRVGPKNSGWLHLIRRKFGTKPLWSLTLFSSLSLRLFTWGTRNIKYKASWLPPVSFDRSLQSRIWLQKQFVQFTDWSQLGLVWKLALNHLDCSSRGTFVSIKYGSLNCV